MRTASPDLETSKEYNPSLPEPIDDVKMLREAYRNIAYRSYRILDKIKLLREVTIGRWGLSCKLGDLAGDRNDQDIDVYDKLREIIAYFKG